MNYQKELDRLLERLKSEERVPRLLLHSCCAPCSSYVLEYLNRYFEITVFYYNPNIYPESEYTKRIWEQQELISHAMGHSSVKVTETYFKRHTDERIGQMNREILSQVFCA